MEIHVHVYKHIRFVYKCIYKHIFNGRGWDKYKKNHFILN